MPSMDFDGDGRDDILWLYQPTWIATNWLGQPDGSFRYNEDAGLDPWVSGAFIGAGDFDGDGRTDTLWYNNAGGLYLSHTFIGGAHYFHWSLGFVDLVPSGLQIAGTGDFNGDGRDDILWRHFDGTITRWLSQSNYAFLKNDPLSATPIDNSWVVAGTGDFNGDGCDDILFRHDSGIVTDWLGQSNGSFAGNYDEAAHPVDPAWAVAGTGDFNGDGRDDILWRHSSGTVTDWLGQPDGSFVGNFSAANHQAGNEWRLAGIGDYNGDGRDDILWRHPDGAVAEWLGRADGAFIGNAAASYQVDPSWMILDENTFAIGSGFGDWDY